MFSFLAAQPLSFERNHVCLFTNIQFALANGELLQLRGANGSGKSTLLRILAGFIEPSDGEVHWHGKSIHAENEAYNPHYVGHQNALQPYLSVTENLQFAAALRGQRVTSSELTGALKKVGLSAQQNMSAIQLSAGQARRLCLAKLILQPSPIWLLDEPATALDAEGNALLNGFIQEQLNQGGIVILATHSECNISSQTIWLGRHHG